MRLFLRKLGRAFRNVLVFLFILGLLFVGFVFHQTIWEYLVNGQSYTQVYLGDKAYKKDDYQTAINHYQRALQLYPEHIKARYNLANIYVVYEDFSGAAEQYRTVLKYDPNYYNAGISLGIILSEEFQDYDQAIQEYVKAIRTKAPVINIPFIYDNRQQIKKAKSIAYYNMGLAFRDKSMLYASDSREYRELLLKAAECYEKSLELDVYNYDAQYNLALTAHILGLYTEALTGYCRAMVIAPLNYEAHFNLAILLKQKSYYKEAYEEFKDVGSLIVYEGDTVHAAYLYSMLNEVSQMVIAENGYEPEKLVKKIDNEIEANVTRPDDDITINELEAAIKKRIKTASICKNYLEGI
ncbi:MAG: hypothetical protein A2Y25_05815 [Candidatus Melainabacteria bacterium GWF2_37_15]|nr:MAG: hypothetical protein A2Y25_05815 [Candidatus Melainabacteria bacterium GWF2_37_15]